MMKIILLASVIASISAIGWHNDVTELKDSNFDKKVAEKEVALVEFYAPWCGHCKRLAPEYEEAAKKLRKESDLPIGLMKIDCTENTETCEKYGVKGYPTLKIFRDGEYSKDYNGPREADGIFEYMEKEAGPPSTLLGKLTDLNTYISGAETAVVGYFTSKATSSIFSKIASSLKDRMRFGHTEDESILDKYPQFKDKVVIHQPEKLRTKLLPDFHICEPDEGLTDCIKRNYHGLVGYRTPKNIQDFIDNEIITVYGNFDYEKDPKGASYWRNRVIQAAQDAKDTTTKFAVSSWDDFKHELGEYGFTKEFTKDDKPVVVARDAKGRKYRMTDEFSIENMKKFISDFKASKLIPFMKSEEEPADDDSGVKTLVAKTFEKYVTDDKDALIEFYAPWCGHCKKLAPIWDQLGAKLKGSKDLIVAKMDATANDVPAGYDVKGFPTIYWKKAGKKPEVYSGGRDIKDFIKYLAEKVTHPLSGWDRKGKEIKVEL